MISLRFVHPAFGKRTGTFALLGLILILLPGLAGCNFSVANGQSLGNTQTVIAGQQTDIAATATQRTTTAAVPATPTPNVLATQIAQSVQLTLAAQPVAPGITPPATPVPGATEPLPNTPIPSGDFETRMKSATILLFEDIVDDPTESRYVQKTLDTMGLQYKDDGNAIGWLKTDMTSGGPNGKPWDLVILAIESRSEVSGEYFKYLNDILNAGSSVILEAWHLDSISEGTVSSILNRCGVLVYPYIPKTGTLNDVIVWPLPGASSSPILSQPNSGLSFTNANDTWLMTGNLGNLMAITGTGDAQLLLGTNASNSNQDGALTVCMGGRLILQTFSSHSFPYSTMFPLWNNYIYNALKVRLTGAP